MQDSAEIERIKGIFKDHVPTYHVLTGEDDLKIETLTIRKPDSGFYSAQYLCHRGTLHVTGDMYAAIYRWGESNDLAWMANCDLGYFQSKAIAVPSSNGINSRFNEWTEKTAKRRLFDLMKELDSAPRDLMALDTALRELRVNLHCVQEWTDWLVHGCNRTELLPLIDTYDTDVFSQLCSIGWDTSVICIQHLYGLKDAMAKLKESA